MLFGSRKGRLEVGNRKERLALPIDRERGGKGQRRIKDLQVKQVFQWRVEHASIGCQPKSLDRAIYLSSTLTTFYAEHLELHKPQ